MRIIEVEQGSEQWEDLRKVRPTASNFKRIIQPAKLGLSASHIPYAVEIAAARLRLTKIPMGPTYAMEYGTDMEPNAVHAYEKQFGVVVEKVGFVFPNLTNAFGGSPDRLVNVVRHEDGTATADGGLEVKCTEPETLMMLNQTGMKDGYQPQVQGLMLITGCKWWDFYVWHPELKPFYLRIDADDEYQKILAEHIFTTLQKAKEIQESTVLMKHEIVYEAPPTAPVWD